MPKSPVLPASAADVRAWALAQPKGTFAKADLDHCRKGSKVRGRVPADVREAFNAVHPRNRYNESAHVRATVVLPVPSLTAKRHTTNLKPFPAAQVREAGRLAGVLGERGRIPEVTDEGLPTLQVLGAIFA